MKSEEEKSSNMSVPTKDYKILSILAITMSGLALFIALIGTGFAIYNTYSKTPKNIKDYVSAHKEELRGEKGDIGPQGFDGSNGKDGANGANGSDTSNPTQCNTWNSGYGFGSVNCY